MPEKDAVLLVACIVGVFSMISWDKLFDNMSKRWKLDSSDKDAVKESNTNSNIFKHLALTLYIVLIFLIITYFSL